MKSITSLYNAFRIRKRKWLMKSHQNPIIDRFWRLSVNYTVYTKLEHALTKLRNLTDVIWTNI